MKRMNLSGRRAIRALALVLFGAALATSVMAVAAKKPKKPVQPAAPLAVPETVRATGVGLPEIGALNTTGAGDYVPAIKAYHDGGQYDTDLGIVAGRAKSFMETQAAAVRAQAKRACNKAKKKKLKGQKRAKACATPKLAIVLDIDETSLSNYTELVNQNFTGAGGALILAIGSADSPAIAPVRDVYTRARQLGISVYAITGRPESVASLTTQNLNLAGYTDLAGVRYKPSGEPTIEFKSGERAKLEAEGFRIIANIGDQESDLTGGHADRAFKLPNPYYFID